MTDFIMEACVETPRQARAAERAGAHRVELCADLARDGLTPEEGVIREVRESLDIPVRVMVRPRPGDFILTPEEQDRMADSIAMCRSLGVEGVVLGICTPERTLDLDAIATLIEGAGPLRVTLHKAIDACADPLQEIDRLRRAGGVDAVLTSGGRERAEEGAALIRAMIAAAGDSLQVIACGRITDRTLPALHEKLNAQAYHGRRIVGELG